MTETPADTNELDMLEDQFRDLAKSLQEEKAELLATLGSRSSTQYPALTLLNDIAFMEGYCQSLADTARSARRFQPVVPLRASLLLLQDVARVFRSRFEDSHRHVRKHFAESRSGSRPSSADKYERLGEQVGILLARLTKTIAKRFS